MITRVEFRGATVSGIRTATFEGREHVVFSVVALVEGVIHASNSPTPELVLAEEFGKVPQGWNGRPVMLNHPEIQGEKTSANEPKVLERLKMGEVFHAAVESSKLVMEAWLDPERVEHVGEDAVKILEAVRKGETIEVSVGAFVQTDDSTGEFNGRRYAGVWRDIVPDHLALLPEGMQGACSVEMGCGAPRAAEEKKMKSLKERFQEVIAKFRPLADEVSDSDLRRALYDALFATEPAFVDVVEVFSDAKQVIYATAPDGALKFFRRGYEMDGSSVSLASDSEEVKQVTKYEPVTASAAPGGCGGQVSTSAPAPPKEVSMEKKAKVAAIIASGKTCFQAADAVILEQLPDERIKALEDHIAESVVVPPKEETPPPPEKKKDEPITEEQALAALPEIKKIVDSARAAATARKTTLVGQLKDAAKAAYTEAQLQAMSLEQLEDVAKLVLKPAADFSGAGAPRGTDDGKVPPTPHIKDRILSMRQKTA